MKINDYVRITKTGEVGIIYNVLESKGSEPVFQVLNDSGVKGYIENELEVTEQPRHGVEHVPPTPSFKAVITWNVKGQKKAFRDFVDPIVGAPLYDILKAIESSNLVKGKNLSGQPASIEIQKIEILPA